MTQILRLILIVLGLFLSSCVNDSSKEPKTSTGSAPTSVNPLKAQSISPGSFNEDTASIITLSYTDTQNRLAQSCSVNSLNKVSISSPCGCDAAGVCTVGVKGLANTHGAASFRFNVSIGAEISAGATASLTINPIDDVPVTSALYPASFLFNTQSVITLPYLDADADLAASCSLSGLSNVSITQACACAAGVCSVGITGNSNYIGAASFDYTVTANGVVSNSSIATLTIVGNPPVAANISPASFPTNSPTVINLSYTDIQNDLATSCSVSNLQKVYVASPCSCSAGVCAVAVVSTYNYSGAASFNYTVTAAGQTSNSALASLSITPSVPVANNISPPAFNEDVNSIITLSYTDPLNRKASTCTISATSNVTVNQACSCDTAGICTVGVKGTSNYNGAASFTYTVTAGGQVSNSATANFSINAIDDNPTVANVTLMDLIYEDTQSGFLTLNYSDVDGDRAGVNDCTITGALNLSVTTPCSCDVLLGTCSLKITGNLHYYGAASFDYKVKTNLLDSNTATASLSIIHLDHAPVSANVMPAAFNEDTQSIITLSYSDVDNDKASVCTLSSLGNVTITRACACDLAGICTVGVTGTPHYNGAASFYYTVTANGNTSNSSTATFTINNVDDVPVATNITPAAFDQNTQSFITLAYSDLDNDKALSCNITGLTNVTETTPCACDGIGVCTVGVTGISNYSGAASFNFKVSANGVDSNSAQASLTINFVNTAPTISALSATFGNENTAYVLNFTIDDIDGPLACSSAISATSTNTTLLPVANIVFGGTYPNCTATMTPLTNIFGSTSLNFKVTDGGGLFSSQNFIHTVRDGVSKTWPLGDAGDSNTYSYSSALIGSVLPGLIELTPLNIDQTDNSNDTSGFTALPSSLTWSAGNSAVMQNHGNGPWTLSSGVYSTTYTSRVMDAKKISNWNSIGWKSSIPFGKELPLSNESTTNYSLSNGAFANDLIGLWHFNEITGTTSLYNSKTALSSTYLVNAPSAAVAGAGGKFRNALVVAGDTVVKSALSSAVTPGTFSVSIWLKKTTAVGQYALCFWTTNDSSNATDCPLRISTVPQVYINSNTYNGTTSINDGSWHHLVIISDSSTLSTKVYVDGVLDGLSAPNFSAAGSTVYIGSNVGTSGNFAGTLDEAAVWNRVLSDSEARELFRRGANRLKTYYRTCVDATCSSNPAWSNPISEADNIVAGEPLATAPNFTIAPADQRFFQYKVLFETDTLPTSSAPDLKDVVVGPFHYSYSTAEEYFVTQEGLSFKSLGAFISTLGGKGCSGASGGVRFQLSKDKMNWSYYNGTAWSVGSNFNSASTSAQISLGLSSYIALNNNVSDMVYIRAFLKSDTDGSVPCELTQLQLDGFE